MPGVIIGLARLNRPSLFIYGGSIRPSEQNTDYVTVCEKTGEFSKGSISEEELISVEKVSVVGLDHAEECIQLIRWRLQLKLLECLFLEAAVRCSF